MAYIMTLSELFKHVITILVIICMAPSFAKEILMICWGCYDEKEDAVQSIDPEFRLTILRNFACPFRAESACRFENSPNECIFGHPETAPIGQLLDLPEYACINYLLERCTYPPKSKQFVSGPNLKEKNILHGCTSALHLDPVVLIDLEHFEAQYSKGIRQYFNDSKDTRGSNKRRQKSANNQKRAEDEALQCGICFDRIRSRYLKSNRQFALLEHCDHCFCGPCILRYRHVNALDWKCPMCRVPFKRFVLSDRFYKSNSGKKRRLFGSHHCQCTGLYGHLWRNN